MSKLVDGWIPKRTKCPFHDRCEIAQVRACHHTGEVHNVDFSCAMARAFDLVERNAFSENRKVHLDFVRQSKELGLKYMTISGDIRDMDSRDYLLQLQHGRFTRKAVEDCLLWNGAY